ncbi:unnamed protein product [Cuscuta epithymum]|nr:unnamed protein product [Cuscuta epithymum]
MGRYREGKKKGATRKLKNPTKLLSPATANGIGKNSMSNHAVNPILQGPSIAAGGHVGCFRSQKLHSQIEIIDISSSCPESQFKKVGEDQVATPSQGSSPVPGFKGHNEKECDYANVNGIEDIKDAFDNLANLIKSQNPNISFQLSPSGVPLMITNAATLMLPSIQKKEDSAMLHEMAIITKGEACERDQNDTHIKKSLFSKFEQCDNNNFYINFKPFPCIPNGGTSTGFVIPKWVPISFTPPADMTMDEIDVALLSYIFMRDENNDYGSEVLISTRYGDGDRKTLNTLMPKAWIDQEVLNLLACKLTYEDIHFAPFSTMWFLPTMFSQYVLDWDYEPEILKGFYQRDFMGKVDCLRKIFIPINDQNVHWYLLIVAFDKRMLILLDSYPSEGRREHRRHSVTKL